MAIIRCPGCGRRVSSLARHCSHCDTPFSRLSREERDRLVIRRWKDQVYRARIVTYTAMGLVIAGALWWWFEAPRGLFPPPPETATVLIAVGVTLYLAGWAWIFWLRITRKRPSR